MKRILLELSVLVVAFVVGCFSVLTVGSGLEYSREFLSANGISNGINFSPKCDDFGSVDIHAESISRHGEFVRITIKNNSCVPAYYRSYTPESLMASYMMNGKKVPRGYCGTGVKRHILLSGATLKFDQTKSSFLSFSDGRKAQFRYGGWFELEGRENREFWSNEFELEKSESLNSEIQ